MALSCTSHPTLATQPERLEAQSLVRLELLLRRSFLHHSGDCWRPDRAPVHRYAPCAESAFASHTPNQHASALDQLPFPLPLEAGSKPLLRLPIARTLSGPSRERPRALRAGTRTSTNSCSGARAQHPQRRPWLCTFS